MGASRFANLAFFKVDKKRKGTPAPAVPPRGDLRDGHAFAELSHALRDLGARWDRLLYNNPGQEGAGLGCDDVVVVVTRPPLDDDDELDRRTIWRSGSGLEDHVLAAARRYFQKIKRRMIRLAPEAAAHLKYPDRTEIFFRVYCGAQYRTLRAAFAARRQDRGARKTGACKTTAAFVLNERLWPGGPRALLVFGMTGRITHAWCYLLRTRFPELLTVPGLTMVEITADPLPDEPLDLGFADSWPVEIILQTELPRLPLVRAAG